MPHLTEMQTQSNNLTLTAVAIGKCIKDMRGLKDDSITDILLRKVYARKLQLLYNQIVDNFELLLDVSIEYLEDKEDGES